MKKYRFIDTSAATFVRQIEKETHDDRRSD